MLLELSYLFDALIELGVFIEKSCFRMSVYTIPSLSHVSYLLVFNMLRLSLMAIHL
jgi:hypothetical protein